MLWKERHTTVGGGLRWLGSRPMVLFFSVLLGCYLLDVAYPVVVSTLSRNGLGAHRKDVCDALRSSTTALAVLGMLGIAASAAVSLTGEREQDTWISLATTLLTPGEIVRAKQLGALWSARRVGVALLVTWAVGLMLGALHPLGVLASLIYVALIAWLIAALGVYASSLAKNSTRAIVTTFVVFLILSVITEWPMQFWVLLFGYQDLPGSWSQSGLSTNSLSAAFSVVIGLCPILAVIFVIGAAITFGSQRRLRATWGR